MTVPYTARLQDYAIELAAGSRERINVDGTVVALRTGPATGIDFEITGKRFSMLPGMVVSFNTPFEQLVVVNTGAQDAQLLVMVGFGDIRIPESANASVTISPPVPPVTVLQPSEVQISGRFQIAPAGSQEITSANLPTATRILAIDVFNSGWRPFFVFTPRAGTYAEVRAMIQPGEERKFTHFPRPATANPTPPVSMLWLESPRVANGDTTTPPSMADVTITGTTDA